MKNQVAAWVLACGLLASQSAARADVVGPEPSSCPDGSMPATCHGGPYCALARCESDAQCQGGRKCAQVSVRVSEIGCAGLIGPGEDPADYNQDVFEGLCTAGASAGCRAERLCMAASGGASGSGSGGSGSGGSGSGGSGSGGSGSGGVGQGSSGNGEPDPSSNRGDGLCSASPAAGARSGWAVGAFLTALLTLARRTSRRAPRP